jgi:hypothetical protein
LRAIWGSISCADRLAEKVMTLAVGNVAKGRILVPTMALQWQECANSGHSPRTCRTGQFDPKATFDPAAVRRGWSMSKLRTSGQSL